MKKLLRSERGYALILTLIFMPIFVGVALMTIDLGRAYNAQQDLQATVDSLALAGASELDGRTGAIARAKSAITQITNTVSFLTATTGSTEALSYTLDSTTPFRVHFLKAIPADDSTAITESYISTNETSVDADAKYVLVYAPNRNLTTLFFDPISRAPSTLPIAALAVATQQSRRTCDLTPMFMCNPYSNDYAGYASAKDKLLELFGNGGLHGRMIKLKTNPSNALIAGNIGFLEAGGSKSTKDLAASLAGEPYGQCINLTDTVDSKPGATTPAWDGFNTRFDIITNSSGAFGATTKYPAASNVRKGWDETTCQTPNNLNRTNFLRWPRFSDNAVGPSGVDNFMNPGDWNLNNTVTVALPKKNGSGTTTYTFPPYWQSLYGSTLTTQELKDISTHPDANDTKPSRYDVYRYEIANASLLSTTSNAGENGLPRCIAASNATWQDRRTMLIAVVDCGAGLDIKSGATTLRVDSYAKVFLVNPVTGDLDTGSDTLDIEIVDLSERSNGEIDTFLRKEVALVR